MTQTYEPEHLTKWRPGAGASSWDDAANYAGGDFTDCYLGPIHRTRDTADSVTLSNWKTISEELDKLISDASPGISTFNHWACGWYEIYLIASTDTAALKAADKIAAKLAEYPIYDEDAAGALELEDEQETYAKCFRREWLRHLEKALEDYAPDEKDLYWACNILDRCDVDTTISGEESQEHTENVIDGTFWELVSEGKITAEHSSDGAWFYGLDRLEMLPILRRITGLELLPPDQQWRSEPYPWPGADPSPLVPPLV